MVAGKVEFAPDEDAHVIGDCIKVSSRQTKVLIPLGSSYIIITLFL